MSAPAATPDLFAATLPQVHRGETWAKQLRGETRVYLVLEADTQGGVTLQNIAAPSSVFQTTAAKILASGYFLVSQAPFVDLSRRRSRKQNERRAQRCPRTLDFIENRADCEPPLVI